MTSNINLSSLLNFCSKTLWYPSAGCDFSVFDVFSPEKLGRIIENKDELPDCFLLTDYDAGYSGPPFIINGPKKGGRNNEIIYKSEDCTVTAFNQCQIRGINVGYDPDMVVGEPNGRLPELYGNVYTADILISYKSGNIYLSTLVYAVAENTRFLYDFLLKNRIKIKYLVRSCYGYGFGGGRSTGMILPHLFKDLKVKYFANDKNTGGDESCDPANIYLTDEQRKTVPELYELSNLTKDFGFKGYDDVILYRVE